MESTTQMTDFQRRMMLDDRLCEKIRGLSNEQFVILDMHISLMELLRKERPADDDEMSEFVSTKILKMIAHTMTLMNLDESGESMNGMKLLKPSQQVAAHAGLLAEQMIKEINLAGHPFFAKKTKSNFAGNPHNEANPEPQRGDLKAKVVTDTPMP